MSDDSTKYTIIYAPEPWIQRTTASALFYSFLGFLVWLSIGSVWWTFLFGCIAFMAVFGRMKMLMDKYHLTFTTKSELRNFVDQLPDDA